MRKIDLKNVVWKEEKYYVAWNLNTALSSFGGTKKEALESLQEPWNYILKIRRTQKSTKWSARILHLLHSHMPKQKTQDSC